MELQRTTAGTTSHLCTGRFGLSVRHSGESCPRREFAAPGACGHPALEVPLGCAGRPSAERAQVWEGP